MRWMHNMGVAGFKLGEESAIRRRITKTLIDGESQNIPTTSNLRSEWVGG